MRLLLLAFALVFSSPIFSQEMNFFPNQVLVRFEPNTDVNAFWAQLDLDDHQTLDIESQRLIAPYMNIWKVKYNTDISAPTLVEKLSHQDQVVVAQLNHHIYSRVSPNDPLYGQQWQWQNIGSEIAWDISTGGLTANGDTIVVAIIDDGTELDHPDLQANIWHNYAEIPNNGMDDDGNGYIDDFNGWNTVSGTNDVTNGWHGVSVAGMVGAVGNDGNQGVGANWNVKLMTIKGGTAEEAEVIEAYSYALNFRKKYNETNGAEGAFVVATNSSWGIDYGNPADVPLWCAFYDTLGANGILSCGATSNSAYDVDTQGDLPTSCTSEYLISVTATDNNDMRTFSAWGQNSIDLGAPGDNIYTTGVFGSYEYTSGTSFATPLTAGVVALLYSAPCSDLANLAISDPAAAAELVRDYIFDGVDQTTQLQTETTTGGRINAGTSMTLAMGNCGACIPPFSIGTSNLLDISSSLNFTTFADGAVVYIRPVGGATWDTIQNATSPVSLTGLQACTEYEVKLRSECPDSLSNASNSFIFKTDGCCDLPENFQVESSSETSAQASWNGVLAANSYTLIYSAISSSTWDTITTSSTNTAIIGLQECTLYEAKVKTNCEGPAIEFSPAFTFKTIGCGLCGEDSVYCSSFGSNNSYEWIDTLIVEDVFTNGSGLNEGGYAFFPDFDINFTQEQEYSLTLVPGYSSSTYNEYVRVWIDFNQSGSFEADELVIAPDFSIDASATFPFTIPTDAIPGQTRMRVIMDYDGIPESSCELFTFGEVEDYCVNIISLGYCLGPDIVNVSDVSYYTANLNWEEVDSSISYIIKYRPVGTEDWEAATTASNGYELVNLDDCTDYEAIVRAVCPNGLGTQVTSTFTTECVSGIATPFAENSFTIMPNPFSDQFEVEVTGFAAHDVQVRLFDATGRDIAIQSTLNASSNKMVITPDNKITAGVYILQLKTDKQVGNIRVIKN